MFILALDHGTTGIKACLIDKQGHTVSRASTNFKQLYPQPGWVEHSPEQLWKETIPLAEKALAKINASWKEIAAIGITNQRETTIVWDPEKGTPLYNAIVWQCRRTAEACSSYQKNPRSSMIREKTGLMLDPYFSATKIRWILDHLKKTPSQMMFGTVDSWIIWHLSGKKSHVTDPTNASRTLLYNIHTKGWDKELLEFFDIPSSILPEVVLNQFGMSDPSLTGGISIPITGAAGDQQAALFGQKCWKPGESKSTYGTGTFIVVNQGSKLNEIPSGLLATLAYDQDRISCFAIEGSIFMAGAILEWLENSLGIIKSPQEADQLALSLNDNHGVYLIPAMAGLGAPQWNPHARGVICGLTQGAGLAHIARAALEAMAYQTRDVIEELANVPASMKVDGGVSKSPFLMQFLADQLGFPMIRSQEADLTSRGAAYLAGLNSGFWASPHEIEAFEEKSMRFEPNIPEMERNRQYDLWKKHLFTLIK